MVAFTALRLQKLLLVPVLEDDHGAAVVAWLQKKAVGQEAMVTDKAFLRRCLGLIEFQPFQKSMELCDTQR